MGSHPQRTDKISEAQSSKVTAVNGYDRLKSTFQKTSTS